MRELKPILDGEVTDALILEPVAPLATAAANTGDDSNPAAGSQPSERFRLPLDEPLKSLLLAHYRLGEQPASEASEAGTEAEESPQGAVNPADSANSADTAVPSDKAPKPPEVTAAPGDTQSQLSVSATTASQAEPTPGGTEGTVAKRNYEEPRVILAPREIQDRIRAGHTVADLVEYSGMPQRKIETFAYPVLAERSRIAELGKQSRPRRQDGPAKLTLWEVLATAFAARGLELAEGQWDSYRDATGQWVVTLSWQVGHSTNVAEWTYQSEGSFAVTIANNVLAAELVDPDFARRNREFPSPSSATEAPEPQQPTPRELPEAWRTTQPESSEEELTEEEAAAEEALLRHTDPDHGAKRRKKTVMPSWEDVLLGVRPSGPKK